MPYIKNPYLTAGLIALAVCFFLWLPTLIRYRITARHLQIRLFGLPIRRVRLDNIKYLGTHPVFFAEKWPNAWFVSHHRFLVIQKKCGLIKNLVITPKHRYVFKAELDHARRALGLNETRPPGNTEFLERNRTDAEKGLQGGDHFTGPIPPAH